jgi:DNA-binding MarR family transcriptional regulator
MKFKPPSENSLPEDSRAQVIELLTQFGIASQLYSTAMDKRLARHGLTLPQLSVLSHLARVGHGGQTPLRVTQIAQAVEVNQPAVTKMLAKFEGAGWVRFQNAPSDRRSRAALITPQGLAHLQHVRQGLFPELGMFLAEWDQKDRSQMTLFLRRLAGFLDGQRTLDDKP